MKTIKIEDELHKKLKIMAAESGGTMSALIEEGANYILGRTPYNEKVSLKSTKNKLEIKPLVPFDTRAGLVKKRGEINAEDYV